MYARTERQPHFLLIKLLVIARCDSKKFTANHMRAAKAIIESLRQIDYHRETENEVYQNLQKNGVISSIDTEDLSLDAFIPGAGAWYEGVNIMACAAENGNTELVNLLLQSKASPNLQPYGKWVCNPPLTSAIEKQNIDLVKALLAAKADPDGRRDDGYDTPLMLVAKRGNLENLKMVKLLLEHKADPNFELGRGGHTAFTLTDSVNVKNCLLENGYKLSDRDKFPVNNLQYIKYIEFGLKNNIISSNAGEVYEVLVKVDQRYALNAFRLFYKDQQQKRLLAKGKNEDKSILDNKAFAKLEEYLPKLEKVSDFVLKKDFDSVLNEGATNKLPPALLSLIMDYDKETVRIPNISALSGSKSLETSKEDIEKISKKLK